jgi:hypothetical protein
MLTVSTIATSPIKPFPSQSIRMHHLKFILTYVLFFLLQQIIGSNIIHKTKTVIKKPIPAMNTKTIKMPLWIPRYTKFNTKTIPYPAGFTKAARAVRPRTLDSSWTLIPVEAIPKFNEQARLQNEKPPPIKFAYKCGSNHASPYVEDIEGCARMLLGQDSCPLLNSDGSKCTSLASQKTGVLFSCSKCLIRAQRIYKEWLSSLGSVVVAMPCWVISWYVLYFVDACKSQNRIGGWIKSLDGKVELSIHRTWRND